MRNVTLFTHTASELSPELAAQLGINMIPETIIWDGNREYVVNEDIQPAEFYKMMAESETLPTTAHPNVATYLEHFSKSFDAKEILFLSITSLMSATYSTALIAAEMLEESGSENKVHVYDTAQGSYGIALYALEAARLADTGLSCAEIISELDKLSGNLGVYLLMQSLHNAKKGGRIGAVRVLAADLFGIKPVVTFAGGLLKDTALCRGFADGLNTLFELYKKQALFGGQLFIFHSDNRKDAEALQHKIREIDPAATIHAGWVGPSIGSYAGSGCVGIAFFKK